MSGEIFFFSFWAMPYLQVVCWYDSTVFCPVPLKSSYGTITHALIVPIGHINTFVGFTGATRSVGASNPSETIAASPQ
jgi:hypothetical protein